MRLRHGFARRLKAIDLPLLIACTGAAVYGLILVRSATATAKLGGSTMQAICLAAGVIAAVGIAVLRPQRPVWWINGAAAVTLLLMGLTFTPFGYTVPGTDDRNWLYLSLGGRSVLFQPSELLKIVFIVTFSAHLSAAHPRRYRPLTLLLLCAHGLIPALLVFLQGDDGNAAVFLLLFASLLFSGGADGRFLLWGTGISAAAVPIVWRHMSPEKQARFLCLIRVEEYLDTTGWQQHMGLIALGSGGVRGVGYRRGGEHNLYARHNDFIFTVAGEEFGIVGTAAVLLVLLLVLWLLYRAARRAPTRMGRLICLGMLSLIGWQSVINVGMNLRLLPVLGVTLPFFSAGGSSLLTLFLGVGIALAASPRTTKEMAPS